MKTTSSLDALSSFNQDTCSMSAEQKHNEFLDEAGVISIVDDRVCQGTHPQSDPFSMARVPVTSLTKQSSRCASGSRRRNGGSSRTHSLSHWPSKTPSTDGSSSSVSLSNEELGVYSQRDVIVGFPISSDPAILLPPLEQQQLDGKQQEHKQSTTEFDSNKSKSFKTFLLHDRFAQKPTFAIIDDNSTFATNATVATNQNVGCWLDMFMTLCNSVAPMRVRGNRASYNYSCNGIQMNKRQSRKKRDDDAELNAIPPVQVHRRRHKQGCSVPDNFEFGLDSGKQHAGIDCTVQTFSTTPGASNAADTGTREVAIYPIARYSGRLNSQELVERRRRSLRKFLTFQPVVLPEEKLETKSTSFRSNFERRRTLIT